MKRIILLGLAGWAFPLAAEPLNYDYVYFSSSDSRTDGADDESGDAFGGFWSFAETSHLFGSLDTNGLYTAGDRTPGLNYDTRTLRLGIGSHYLIGKRTMIAPALALLRSRTRVNAPGWMYAESYRDNGYGMQVDVRHAFTNWFEVTGGARYVRIFDDNETEWVGGVVFHPTRWLALGALYHDGDGRRSTELTVRWYY